MSHVEKEGQRHARRHEEGKYSHRPLVAKILVHDRNDDREDRRTNRAEDDRRCECARAVRLVRIHEVLRESLHDERNAGPERRACENGYEPEYMRRTCPFFRYRSRSQGNIS